MRKQNSNERRATAMLKMAQSDNFGDIYDRARTGAFRKAAARAFDQGSHYLRVLLMGNVAPCYRSEMIQSVKECMATSKVMRTS